jgi:hypothetical protein
MKLSWPFPGWNRWRVLYGLFLMTIAGPIGDVNDFLGQMVFPRHGAGGGDKYYHPYQYDRLVGCVILIWGWCQIARGLGAGRKSATAKLGWLRRLRDRFRYLPVPVLGTLLFVFVLGYPRSSRQLVTVDVSNVPPGTTLRVHPRVTSNPSIDSRYLETFDYLFFLVPFWSSSSPRPPATAQMSSEFRLDGSPFSLIEWTDSWERLYVSAFDEDRHMGAFLTLWADECAGCSANIEVNRESLQPCAPRNYSRQNEPIYDGTCFTQTVNYPRGSKEVHVSVDLNHIELAPYSESLESVIDD